MPIQRITASFGPAVVFVDRQLVVRPVVWQAGWLYVDSGRAFLHVGWLSITTRLQRMELIAKWIERSHMFQLNPFCIRSIR